MTDQEAIKTMKEVIKGLNDLTITHAVSDTSKADSSTGDGKTKT